MLHSFDRGMSLQLLVPMTSGCNVPSGGLTLIVGTQKWGLSCKVQRRPPAYIFLNESLPQKPPCGHHVHGRHGHGSSMKNRWRFLKFCEKYETLTLTSKICILRKNGFKELTLSCLKAWFKGYTFCCARFLVRPSTEAQQSHERAPKNVQMTKVSFVCLTEDVWPSSFGECLKMPQR